MAERKERAMWRYLPPAFLVVAAMGVLLAGAGGDAQSWTAAYDLSSLPSPGELWQGVAAHFATASASPVSPLPPSAPPAVAVAPPAAPVPDATGGLRRQIDQLQAQVTQQKQQIASVSATADQARQDAAALRQQRPTEPAAANPPAPEPSPAATPQAATPNPAPSSASAQIPAHAPARPQPPTVTASRPPPPKPLPRPANPPPQSAPASAWISVPTQHVVPAKERLAAARQALLAGRNEEARSLMETAQLQFVFSPVDPNASAGDTINMPATWIGRALTSLQLGDASGALRDIDQAMNSS
jgi:hypothetical protein